ncbi:RHS repeat domain-containing protein [Pseudomonas sp. GM48]|uniref:RHS repeat domain-containing protein n=1 Tax=Pseudomonas sp. GM48 TaxID=1144330 RepID=UPI0002705227|nr:RHS repeat-associated core domain-containing protein [Pseudomonas sp. GM48]EJM60157.1 RHS repeat-associated core domain protein containing protein [Pseudomonas sp. GM48]
MASESLVYSNAFNFNDFVNGSVDARTGMYTFSVSLGEIKSGGLNGPSLPIQLQFNPLNSTDTGFGKGWHLALTRYDVLNKVLSLSSGERYKASETASALLFSELKLNTLKVSKPEAGRYDIVHKNGVLEELRLHGSSNIAVPIRIVAANGTSITLAYTSINGLPVLSEVRDAQRVLLSITRNASVKLTLYPGTDCEAAFTLSQSSAQVKVGMPIGGEWKLGLQQIGGLNCIISVESPLGGMETIRYKTVGHRFPPLGPLQSMPCVSAHISNPRFDQPSITTNYDFSDANFLGFGAGINWSNDGDNLYRVAANYTYTSTERLMLGDRVHSFTVRTYNKFHLLLSQVTTCGDALTTRSIEYHQLPGVNLAGQPEQFRMPKVETVIHENRRTGVKSPPQVTRTEYDEWGNLLRQTEPSGVTTVCEFYPSTASDGCPADPLGFVRFEKQRTVSPATGFASAPTSLTRYRYDLLTKADSATVPGIVPVQEQFLELSGQTQTLRAQTDLDYFNVPSDPSRHGLVRKQTVIREGKPTHCEFEYRLNGTVLELQTTQTGFDGARKTTARTLSAINGTKLSERNEDEGTVIFTHDPFGRLLRETVAPGTAFEASRSWSYQLASGSVTPASMVSVDVNGVQQRVTCDGLGRTIRIDEQDSDSQAGGPLRMVYSAQYNAIGQLVEEIATDWLQGVPLGQKKSFVFDEWGQLKTTLHADGRAEHLEFDPVTLQEASWQQGMGKTVTVYQKFGKPQSVETFDLQGRSLGKILHEYDGLGRGVSQTDPAGNKTLYQYDVFNRLRRSVLPDGHAVETEYAVHSHGQLPIEVKVAGRSLGQQTFDGLGRLIQSKVGGRVTTAGFEAGVSKPVWEQTPGGDRVEYRYEPNLGGLVTQRKAGGLVASYSYDHRLGLPTMCTEQGRETRFEYYPSGRLKSETSTQGARQEKALYTYSLGGRPLTCTDVFGNQHKTDYDQHGRPKSFEHNSLKAAFTYNALGQLAMVNAQEANGTRSLLTRLAYDDLGREVSRSFEVSGSGTQTLTSSYTLASKLAQRMMKSGNEVLRDERFSYDRRGRLTEYTCSGTQRPRDPHGKEIIKQIFVLDAMDNIVTLETEFPGGKNLCSYEYSASDPTQLIGIRHSHKDYPAPVVLQYDANGQLIKDEQVRMLTYDALGRLTQVASAVGAVVRGYHYDAQDRLVEMSQRVGPVTRRYYREGRVINEENGQDKSTCLHNVDVVLGQSRQGQSAVTRLLGTDQQQSVLTEVMGAQRQDVAYSPYGHRPAEGGLFSLLGFSGQQLDPLTGLYLLGNGYRAYSPTLMRFLSPDSMSPFGAGGLNPYAYCGGDPINRVDPTGHFWKALLGIALSIAGFALSVVTMGAATPLAVIGLTLAASSATLGVAGIIVNEVAPESGVGGILGWASLATGVLSAGAGLGALGKGAVQWGNKLANAYKPGLSSKGAQAAAKEMAKGMGKGSSKAGSSIVKGKGAKAAAKVAKSGGKADDAPVKWSLKEPKGKNIKADLSDSAMEQYDVFRKGVADEGLSPVQASQKMGDPKYTLLEKKLNRFEVRISGKDRVTFLVDETDHIVEILQVGGHT